MPKPRRAAPLSPSEAHYLELLGQHVRDLRVARGLGLEELADQAGLHRTHLWKIEKGRLNAGIVSYLRLAVQLGVSPGALLPDRAVPDSFPEERLEQASRQR